MKKITWIIALLAALALIFVGCPGGGDDDGGKTGGGDDNGGQTGGGGDGDVDLTEIFSATPTTQDKATVTVSGDTVTCTVNGKELWAELVMPEGTYWDISAYTGFKFDYKTSYQSTVYLMMDDGKDGAVFVFGWGAFTSTDGEWWEKDCPFTDLQRGWPDDGPATIDKTKIMKLMFRNGGDSEVSTNRSFEIRNFTTY